VNVFASWCVPCRLEHPILLALQGEGLAPIYGLNHRDRPEDAAPWLDKLGDPYTRTGADVDGRVGAAWGIYGVPQTFVIDRDGRIAYAHLGPLTQTIVDEKLRPIVLKLRGTAGRNGDARSSSAFAMNVPNSPVLVLSPAARSIATMRPERGTSAVIRLPGRRVHHDG
jgi:cytochrome c biogenesis protein CcmG/thiol:disulfide interchange protein DsbE